jgi:hypothetical protein
MFSTGAGAFQLIRRPETSRPIETKLGTTDKAKETSRHDKSNAGHPRVSRPKVMKLQHFYLPSHATGQAGRSILMADS